MSNKSINSKGLSRQLEEKAQKLQSELNELRSRSSQSELDGNSREQRLQKEIIRLQQQHEGSDENLRNLNTRIQQIAQELVHKTEEKDLLHTRHEALTAESHSLQKDLSRSQAQLRELERSLEAEREHALNNDRQLREEARRDTDRSNIEIGNLQRRLDDQSSQLAADKDHWASQRRSLESQLEKANERAAGLQRTIEKLQESEGTLSGREHKLQEALESEKERHQNEEAVLTREMQELDRDINQKRTMIENVRAELSRGKEELRTSKRDVASLEEKVQALEDEVDVLQGGLDEESERARGEISQARQEAEITRRDLHAAKQELIRAEAAHADAKAEIERFQGNLQAGLGSNEQVSSRLREIESQLQQVRKDKQSLQDKLAGVNIELHSLRSSVAETEAERDELRDQLKQTGQIDKIFEADQEKLDLQKAKLRLESDLSRLREECENCIERNVALEHKLQEEIQRAAVEEGHLHDELANSQRKLSAASSGRDRELNTTKQRCQRLEARIGELESRLLQADEDSSANHELSALQRDLSATRRKETEYLQRESSHREAVRDLKQRITSLERQAHEAEVSKLAVDSPKSSVGGSARKAEVVELRHQLTNAQQQLRDYRVKSRDAEKDLHRQLSDVERRAQANVEALEQQREELEQDLLSTRHNQESQQIKLDTTEKTISRLRSRIQTLESSLLSARQDNTGNRTMADERKDLHEMLKDAKLEAEDLQLQISAGQARLKSATTREQEVRTTLHRVRTERNQQQKESSALSKELGNLQSRYERAVSRFAREQKKWEDERRSIVSRVRFPNMSISEVKDNGSDEQLQALQTEMQAKERQHAGEIRGLSYQIRWLRSKWERELGFRRGLALQKRYLNLRIEMFEAWYASIFLPSSFVLGSYIFVKGQC